MNIPTRTEINEATLRANVLKAFDATARSTKIEHQIGQGEVSLPKGWKKARIAFIIPRIEMMVRAFVSRQEDAGAQDLDGIFSDATEAAISIAFGTANNQDATKASMSEIYATHCALLNADSEYQVIYAEARRRYDSVLKAART